MYFPHTEQSSIAWFKLAEFVGRKEKERALYLFRLLVHSIADTALVAQLEGDLLAAFGDEKAVESYEKAMRCYLATERLCDARLLFERISGYLIPDLSLQYAKVLQKEGVYTQRAFPMESTELSCR
jgi:hypothetical protein